LISLVYHGQCFAPTAIISDHWSIQSLISLGYHGQCFDLMIYHVLKSVPG